MLRLSCVCDSGQTVVTVATDTATIAGAAAAATDSFAFDMMLFCHVARGIDRFRGRLTEDRNRTSQ